ncbi:nuclear export mediator factor NEMF [Tanacetum coccineum]
MQYSPYSTLESSFDTLNVKKFDVAFSVDPLYHQTSAQFDEGGAKDEAGQERANGRRGDDDTLDDADKIAMEEDDIKEIGEDEKEKLTDVDYLTGNPLPNDILMYVVPVCAPYTTLQSYKYRVKIIPGTTKKGKVGLSQLKQKQKKGKKAISKQT